MTFLAAVLEGFNQPLKLMELKEPDALDVGQVWVQFECAAICGAQINEISGAKGSDPYLPHLLGHEGFGEVVRIGPGVKHVKAGDKVVAHWRKGLGIDAAPPKYRTGNGYNVGAGPVSTFAECGAISENRLTKVPNDTPKEVGALLGCAVTTGVGAVIREAKTQPGESILIVGAGGVGLSAILGANLVNAFPVCAVDMDDHKLRLAHHLGANICGSREDCRGTYDIVIETTGNPAMIEWALEHTAHSGGRLVLVGQPSVGEEVSFTDFRKHYFGKTILDSQGGGTLPHLDIPRLLRLYKANRLPISHIATDWYKLTQINQALDAMRNGEVSGRCMIAL